MSNKREVLLESELLRVRFELCADRYAHEVWLADGANWICVLKSVEGSPLDDWPASPPLQSLHLERRDGGRGVALAVGMAGQGHWSASVELDPAGRSTNFDIAWRGRGALAGSLGSCYEAVQSHPAEDRVARQAVFIPDASSQARLAVEPGEPPLRVGLQLTQGGVNVVPELDAANPSAQTIRWAYRLTALSGDARL